MDISIEAFRNRIGTFNTIGHHSYIPENTRNQFYKSSTRTANNFRKFITCMVLVISILSKLEIVLQEETQDSTQDSTPHSKYMGSLATSTLPVFFFILGGQVSASFFPVNHLSYHDVVGVHSAATLQGVQAVHLNRG